MFTSLPNPTHREPMRQDADGPFHPWLLWRPETPAGHAVLTIADRAECECPDLCNRDHDNE
jgi:hypothetical protein